MNIGLVGINEYKFSGERGRDISPERHRNFYREEIALVDCR